MVYLQTSGFAFLLSWFWGSYLCWQQRSQSKIYSHLIYSWLAKQRISLHIFNTIFFPQGWASFILHLFSGMCRKPYNAIWRHCVAEIASREFSFMLYPKMLMWLFTTLPSFIKRSLCSCGVLWMWLAEQTSGKFAGVKQIAALEKIQTVWEWHSVLFSVEKL